MKNDQVQPRVIVRGAGDLATAILQKLHRSGFSVLALETPHPLAIRRTVALCEAVYTGSMTVEDITAERVSSLSEVERMHEKGHIPILVDPEGESIGLWKPFAVVDATVSKRNIGMRRDLAPCTISIGPGCEAGRDVDIVIETQRGHHLGRLIFSGCAEPNTGIPGIIGGKGAERVYHTPCAGIFSSDREIGDILREGEVFAEVDGVPIEAKISGCLRGLLRPGTHVRAGWKCADIDPRGEIAYAATISEKGRAIAGGVLEAIMIELSKKKNVEDNKS